MAGRQAAPPHTCGIVWGLRIEKGGRGSVVAAAAAVSAAEAAVVMGGVGGGCGCGEGGYGGGREGDDEGAGAGGGGSGGGKTGNGWTRGNGSFRGGRDATPPRAYGGSSGTLRYPPQRSRHSRRAQLAVCWCWTRAGVAQRSMRARQGVSAEAGRAGGGRGRRGAHLGPGWSENVESATAGPLLPIQVGVQVDARCHLSSAA